MVTTSRTALLDACVLVPMPLADTLLRLAAAGVFVPKSILPRTSDWFKRCSMHFRGG